MAHLLQIHEPGQTPLPHSEAVAVGIDLGTTHSVVAIADGSRVQAIGDAQGRTIIPSVVLHENGRSIVGHEAQAARALGKQVYASIKRQMGKTEGDASTLPVQISADILRYMKHTAELSLGRAVTDAVITVPAYFDDAARTATRDAARLAGLNVLRLINEPTAAALAYGLDTQKQGTFAIYDLGGGTFDVSILKLEDGVFQVLATAGDTELGGDDVDALIADYVIANTGEKLAAPTKSSALDAHCGVMLLDARRAKEALSQNESVQIQGLTLTRATLATIIQPLIARTLLCIDTTMQDANLTSDAIDGVVLVGGSTRLLAVREAVQNYFGKPPLTDLNPDEVVALGAAIQAHALTQGAEHLLLDVTPLSLGLETMGGIVEKVIYRNSLIPVSMSQEFTTYEDGQTSMKIHVLQGEREKVEHCRSLGQFTLSGIPPMVAGAARIRIDFTVDADGLLTVAATEMQSGIAQKIEVKPSYGLAFEDIEAMLLASMENAQADIIERLLIEVRVEATRAISEVERAIEAAREYLKQGEEAMIRAQMGTLSRAIQGTDRDRIDYEVEQLNRMVGPFAERRMNAAIGDALKGQHVDAVNE